MFNRTNVQTGERDGAQAIGADSVDAANRARGVRDGFNRLMSNITDAAGRVTESTDRWAST